MIHHKKKVLGCLPKIRRKKNVATPLRSQTWVPLGQDAGPFYFFRPFQPINGHEAYTSILLSVAQLPSSHLPLLLSPLSERARWLRRSLFARPELSQKRMNQSLVQQNAVTSSDETRSPVLTSDRKGSLVCPRPRRLGVEPNGSVRPPRCLSKYPSETFDSTAGNDLLELILSRGKSHGGNQPPSHSESPPFLRGSPPSRAPNPLIHDARFGQEKPGLPPSPVAAPLSLLASPLAARKGCGPLKFGPNPAAVRIEGFDCRDRQNRSITAVA